MTCKGQPSAVSPRRTSLRHASPTTSPTCVVGPLQRTPLNAPTVAAASCSAHGDAADCLASRSVAAGFTSTAGRRMGRCCSPSDGACRLRHAGDPRQQRVLGRRRGRRGSRHRAKHRNRMRRRGTVPCHRVGRGTRWRRSDRLRSRVERTRLAEARDGGFDITDDATLSIRAGPLALLVALSGGDPAVARDR